MQVLNIKKIYGLKGVNNNYEMFRLFLQVTTEYYSLNLNEIQLYNILYNMVLNKKNKNRNCIVYKLV